jgi:hypothetical protein
MRTFSSFEIGPVTIDPNKFVATAVAIGAFATAGCGSNPEHSYAKLPVAPPAAEQPIDTAPIDPDGTSTRTGDVPDYSNSDNGNHSDNKNEDRPTPDTATQARNQCKWSPPHPQPTPRKKRGQSRAEAKLQRIIDADCINLSDSGDNAPVYSQAHATEVKSLGKIANGTVVRAVCVTTGQKLTDKDGISSKKWTMVTISPTIFDPSTTGGERIINADKLYGRVLVPAGVVGYQTNNVPDCTKKQLAAVAARQ